MTPPAIEKKCTEHAAKHLVGKTIKLVRYMNADEANVMMWGSRPLVIQFTDGSIIYAVSDDEGNDGGALHGQSSHDEQLVFGVLR